MFKGGFAGKSGIVIRNLTISGSTIVSSNDTGSGAFIEDVDSMQSVILDDCHLVDSNLSGSRTGGLIGYTSGYDNVNDGPVDTYITISGCSVTGCTITGSGSVGGIVGHSGANPATYTSITNCKVSGNNIVSKDDGGWRVGSIVGTCNVGETVITGAVLSDNTLTQGASEAPECHSDEFGRFVASGTGTLVIDGAYVAVDKDTLSRALDVNDAAVDIVLAAEVIELEISAWNDPYYIGGESTTRITIDGNGNKINFVHRNSDWNYVRCMNDGCELVLENMDITNSGYNNGPWNRHDIRFYNKVVLNDVVSDKALALLNDAVLEDVVVTDDSGSVYLLWITASGSDITITNGTFGSEELTNDTRGIAIKDQYVDSGDVASVTLSIYNSKIVTNNTEKAAIYITSVKGADITIRNLDTSGVASGADNVVALDEAYESLASEIPINVSVLTDEPYEADDGVLSEGMMDLIFNDVESQEMGGETDITVTIVAGGSPSITFPVEGFGDAPDFTMDIVTDVGTVSVPSYVIATLDGEDVTVSIDVIDLPPQYSHLPTGSVAYDVSILIDDSSVHELDGTLTVYVDESLPSRVIHILGDGQVEYPVFGIGSDGRLFIELTSLSDIILDYTIQDDDEEDDLIPSAPSTGSGDSGDGDDTTLYVACVVAAAVVAVLAILALTTNRN